jgi:formamidopyrimidine-DNA glycosylase
MPEIIEVKKYCDFINKYTKNKYILDINILQGRYKKHKPFEGYYKIKNLLPLKLLKAESKGKFIYITFENDIILFCTLGLSGGWTNSFKKTVY